MRRYLTLLSMFALGLAACRWDPAPRCPEGELVVNGECVVICNDDRDCPPALSCVDDICGRVNNECEAHADCTTPGACETSTGVCVGGLCEYTFVLPGTDCDDRDDCTDDDTCRVGGVCAGNLRVCDTPPHPACTDATTARVYEPTGVCLAGECSYESTTVTCSSCPECLGGCAFDSDGDGVPELIDAGAADPQNACEYCDPAAPTGWTEVSCVQPTPRNVCQAAVGVCEPGGGDCLQGGCCHFDPIWPEGAGGEVPRCALAGEDPDGDGVEDSDETWSGRCDHDGHCTGCVWDSECNDGNPCTTDLCSLSGVCLKTDVIGSDCTIAFPSDGTCVSSPVGAVCRLDPGFACLSGGSCASGYCVCADDQCADRVCHESGCAACTHDSDGLGACAATPPGNHGQECIATGFACDGAGTCRAASGELCTNAADCAFHLCECADSVCSVRRCSVTACDCGFNGDGDAVCDGLLDPGRDDARDSCGVLSCNGDGRCGHWGAAVKLYEGGDSADAVAPAVNAAGDIVAMWRQRDPDTPDYELYDVMTRRRAGGSWLDPEQVSATGLPLPNYTFADSAYAVAALGGGTHDFAMIWRQWNGSETNFWYNRLSGGVWGSAAELPVCGGWHTPLPALLGDGRIIAFCKTSTTVGRSQYDLNDVAGWQSAWQHVDLPPYTGADDLQAQIDAAGRTTLLFSMDYGEVDTFYVATIWSIVFDGGWGAIENVDGLAADEDGWLAGDSTIDSRDPRSVIDNSGNVTATWRRRNHPDEPEALWGARYEGSSWGAPQPIGSFVDLSQQVSEHAMVVDGAGNVTVAWIERSGTTPRSVWAARWSGDWSSPALLESDDTGDAVSVSMVVDGAGNVTVFWKQYDGSADNLWANRYDILGGNWSGRSLIVAGSSGVAPLPWRHHSSTTAATDGAFVHPDGDATLLWRKWDTTGAQEEVTFWATRVRPGTAPASTRIDGEVVVPLTPTNPGVTGPFVVEQADGTAAIVWQVKRSADYQIWFVELR